MVVNTALCPDHQMSSDARLRRKEKTPADQTSLSTSMQHAKSRVEERSISTRRHLQCLRVATDYNDVITPAERRWIFFWVYLFCDPVVAGLNLAVSRSPVASRSPAVVQHPGSSIPASLAPPVLAATPQLLEQLALLAAELLHQPCMSTSPPRFHWSKILMPE